jgi:type IV pilus assembly protein PilO
MAMNLDLKDKLNQWLLLVIMLIGGGGYVYWTYVWEPRQLVIATLTQEEEKLSGELTLVKTQMQRLAQLREELKQAEADFAKLQEMFPDVEKIPSRLQDLLTVTRRSGTVTTKFTPLPSADKPHYTENNYRISVRGSYHSIGEMFAEIANFKYPTSIQKMVIDVAPDLKEQLLQADKHGTIASTVAIEFDFTTYTSRK